jgi:hypothetical protein
LVKSPVDEIPQSEVLRVPVSPASPKSNWPFISRAPAAVIDQSLPPVMATVVAALELPMAIVSEAVLCCYIDSV